MFACDFVGKKGCFLKKLSKSFFSGELKAPSVCCFISSVVLGYFCVIL